MRYPSALATRRLLRQLATPPTEPTDSDDCRDIAELIDGVREFLQADEECDEPSIPASTLHEWRTSLDQVLHEFETANPAAWAHARQPGTWLDNHLRLRSLLAHEVAKAYWDNKTHIDYASIDIEGYLWGAR